MQTPTLRQARQGFKLNNQVENKSIRTIGWYENKLDEFETWLLGQTIDADNNGASPKLSDITANTIRSYIEYLQGRKTTLENHPHCKTRNTPLSPYTIRGSFRSLAAFFNWAKNEDLITTNPFEKLKVPKVPKSIKPRFQQDDIEKLLAACEQYPEVIAARNRTLLLFLLSTGVRAGELCGLTLDTLDIEHGKARVTGKGAKDREVYFGKTVRKALWQYVTIYRMTTDTNFVFLTRSGDPITVSRLQHILKDIGDRAQVPHCHPHRFRHTAARLLVRNGADVFSVQRILGHETLEMTRRYVELEREDVELAAARADPVDRMNLK